MKKGTITKNLNCYFISSSNRAIRDNQNERSKTPLAFLFVELFTFSLLPSGITSDLSKTLKMFDFIGLLLDRVRGRNSRKSVIY